MTTLYVNTDRTKTTSSYVKTAPSFDGTELTVDVRSVAPSVSGTIVPMVRGFARVTVPAPVASCDPSECGSSVNEAVELKFNVKRGSDITSLRAEVNRVLDIAIAQHSLLYGVVPPATANFGDA